MTGGGSPSIVSEETRLRDAIAEHGRSLFMRGFGVGSSGNISVRLDDGGILITPTNSCMGRLDPGRVARLGPDGRHLSGDKPSKEQFLHAAMYRVRPGDRAVAHLHSTHAVAVGCLDGLDPADVLPPLTAYYVMRIGRLPLVPYYRPGDMALADAVAENAAGHHAMLLANHGPVVSGRDLDTAVYAIEELEETAKLFLMLDGRSTRLLSPQQVAELRPAFPA